MLTQSQAQELAKEITEFCRDKPWFRKTAVALQQHGDYVVAVNINNWGEIQLEEQFALMDKFPTGFYFRLVTEMQPLEDVLAGRQRAS